MKLKIDVGKIGEEKAVAYLEKNGYKIIKRNFRNKFGEIDIIAFDRRVICFIEVRTRQGSLKHELALESISRVKQQRLSRLAVSFLKENNWLNQRARFDVVSVLFSDQPDQVHLLKDAFPVSGWYY